MSRIEMIVAFGRRNGKPIIKDVTLDQNNLEDENDLLNEIMNLIEREKRRVANAPVSEIIAKFCADNVWAKTWAEKTEFEKRAILKLLKDIVGDKAFSSLGHNELRAYNDTLLRLPPNINKNPRYRTKSIGEILQLPNTSAFSF